MNELWLSIKIWTQRILLALLAIYAVFFVLNNSGDKVSFWFWFKHETKATVFLLTAMAFVAGMVVMLLLSTAIRTFRQVKDLRSRGRQEKMERELADMKAKAAMLQTKPPSSPSEQG